MEATEQNRGNASPDLTPDEGARQGLIGRSFDAVAMVGYLGEAPSDQYRRLYQSIALNRWIEILAVDILHRLPAAESGDLTPGQSVIWVRRDAEVTRCESVRASSFEEPPWEGPDPPPPLRWPRP